MRVLIEGCWGSDGRNVRGLIEGYGEERGSEGWNVRALLIEGCVEEWGRDG